MRTKPNADDYTPAAEPWLTHPRWSGGRARSSALAELFPWWFGAVCFAAMLCPLAFTGLEPVRREGTLALGAVGLFGLATLWLVARAVRATLAWRRFGRLEVLLDPFPGSVGGQAGGAIEVPITTLPADARVVLSCVEVIVTGGGNHRSRRERVVWSREQRPDVRPGPLGSRLAFTFDVPSELPQTEPPSRHHHYWAVRVVASVPGLNLDRVIEVPVYRTSTPLRAARPLPAPEARPAGDDMTGALAPGVRIARRAGSIDIFYATSRARAAGAMMLVFGLLFGAGAVGLASAGVRLVAGTGSFAVLVWPTLLLFIALFGGVAALLALLGGWMLGNSLEVRLGHGTIETTRRFLGVPCRRRRVAIVDVERLELAIDGQVGQGGAAEVSYRARGIDARGGSIALGDGVRGTPAAERLAALLEAATGLSPEIVVRPARARPSKLTA